MAFKAQRTNDRTVVFQRYCRDMPDIAMVREFGMSQGDDRTLLVRWPMNSCLRIVLRQLLGDY